MTSAHIDGMGNVGIVGYTYGKKLMCLNCQKEHTHIFSARRRGRTSTLRICTQCALECGADAVELRKLEMAFFGTDEGKVLLWHAMCDDDFKVWIHDENLEIFDHEIRFCEDVFKNFRYTYADQARCFLRFQEILESDCFFALPTFGGLYGSFAA